MPATAQPGTAHPRAVLAIVLITYLMIIVDTSVVITGLPHIRRDLGFDDTGVSWVQNAYTLAFGGLLLLGARAGDLYGRRRVLLVGLALFSSASLAVGAAPVAGLLVAARAVQGVGAAILAPSTLALITASFPEGPQRSRAVVWYGSVAGIGAAVGLVLGGLLADLASWRVAFAINVPIGVLLMVLAVRYLDRSGRRAGRLDVAGAVTSTLGMTALADGIVRLGDAGRADRGALAMLAVGVVLVVTFVLVERRAAQPIMPLHLLADRVRTGAYLTRFAFIAAMITYFLFVSRLLQDAWGWSALAAGLAFLPMTLVNFVVAARVQRLLGRFGARLVLPAGIALALVGLVWLAQAPAVGGYVLSVGVPCVLIGAGQGLAFAPMTSAGIAGARAEEAGAASGVLNAFHQLGGAIGLAATTAVAALVAGTPAVPSPAQVAARVDAAMGGASVLMGLALVATLVLVVPAHASSRRREVRAVGNLMTVREELS